MNLSKSVMESGSSEVSSIGESFRSSCERTRTKGRAVTVVEMKRMIQRRSVVRWMTAVHGGFR